MTRLAAPQGVCVVESCHEAGAFTCDRILKAEAPLPPKPRVCGALVCRRHLKCGEWVGEDACPYHAEPTWCPP